MLPTSTLLLAVLQISVPMWDFRSHSFWAWLFVGLIAGWLTAVTGGIAAAFLGHAATRFAVFLATGHTGQTLPKGREVEEIDRRRRPPDGWRVIGSRESAQHD